MRSPRLSPWLASAAGMVALVVLLFFMQRQPVTHSGRTPIPTLSPDERIETALLQTGDLPKGWASAGRKSVRIAESIARRGVFQGMGSGAQSWMTVSQNVALYPTVEASTAGFRLMVEQAFPSGPGPSDWVHLPELDFENGADQITSACMPVTINETPLLSCSVEARYGDMVTEVWANVFEDDWLTMPQFRDLLKKMDERMRSARLPQRSPRRAAGVTSTAFCDICVQRGWVADAPYAVGRV